MLPCDAIQKVEMRALIMFLILLLGDEVRLSEGRDSNSVISPPQCSSLRHAGIVCTD